MSNSSIFSTHPVIENEMATANYHVSGSSPFVMGHYPGDAIFPGVMSLHYMKKLSETLFYSLTEKSSQQIQLKRISYIDVIRPGDVLMIQSKVKKRKDSQWHIQAHIESDGIVKTRASFVYVQ